MINEMALNILHDLEAVQNELSELYHVKLNEPYAEADLVCISETMLYLRQSIQLTAKVAGVTR